MFQEVDKLTTNLHSRAEKQWKGVAHLTGVLLMLPEIVQTMNVLKVKTSVIAELFETVEKSLIELEDIMEERELQQKKTDQEIQLSLHKDKRLAILDDLRCKCNCYLLLNIFNCNICLDVLLWPVNVLIFTLIVFSIIKILLSCIF